MADQDQNRYRLRHLIRQAEQTIADVQVALDERIALDDEKLAQIAANMAQLEGIAGTAESAITTGAQDRAQLRAMIGTLTARVVNLEAHPVAVGYATTPALALLATQTVTVTLNRAMPDGYVARAIGDTALAGKLGVTAKPVDATTVTVTLTALVAVGAGAVTVIAYA